MSLFKDKVLLITGGTGSFGNAVLNRFLKTDIGEIRISPMSVFKKRFNTAFPNDPVPPVINNTLSLNKLILQKSYFIQFLR